MSDASGVFRVSFSPFVVVVLFWSWWRIAELKRCSFPLSSFLLHFFISLFLELAEWD